MNVRIMTNFVARVLTALVMLTAPVATMRGQVVNKKFSMTTQMFLNGLKEQTEPSVTTSRHVPMQRRSHDGRKVPKQRRLIASPDTVGGVAYISCFIHLKDAGDLSAVRALGVEVEETFDGLDFVTARVPVNQLEALADIDNVTRIKVARRMRPLTDAARQATNADDLLTESPDAIAQGITSQYDGKGVILGIIDTGIDFQHIAFKDKNGNSRIKRAYVYDGSYNVKEYEEYEITSSSPTTDDDGEDHGTHTASTAGGSSVIVSGSTVTVTDDHANATYGGIAPGADLYLAGIKELDDTYLTSALNRMVNYAEAQGKPLVVSNSWGSGWGPRDGTGEFSNLVAKHFGDNHPNRVILFASSNDAGHRTDNEQGGFFVSKSKVSSSNPLGSIIRTDGEGGDYYVGLMACAWSERKLNCKLYVLDNSTGAVLKEWKVTTETSSFSGLKTYYSGSMKVFLDEDGDMYNGKYQLAVYSENGIDTKGDYTLAIEVYPANGSADVNMWAGDWSYFTAHLSTSGYTWTAGTDDMSVSDEATIPNAISVGAYVSKDKVKNSQGTTNTYKSGTVGDIAYYSSYATAELSPTGLAYPWITAPGAQLVAGVNHYDKSGSYSYFDGYKSELVVNNKENPYGAMEGTSMATPVAAGIVALWLQAAQEVGKELTVNDVKDIMRETAITDSYTEGANASRFGHGKIDALAGIQYILGTTGGPVIKATPKSIDFGSGNYATKTYTKTLTVKGFNLNDNVNVNVNDNDYYSVSQTSVTQGEAADGANITITYAPLEAGTHTATITLTSEGADDVVVPLTATAKAAVPTIIAEPETLAFAAGLDEPKSLTFDVLSEFLTDDVTVTLTDANEVFSTDKASVTVAETEGGATVTVTFQSATADTYAGTVTLSSDGAEDVAITLSGTASATSEEIIDFTAQGFENAEAVESVSGTDCTVAFNKGSNKTNPPKYYNKGTAIRLYGGNTMTIASKEKTIVEIELTFGSDDDDNDIITDVGSFSSDTWTGSASSVRFTIDGRTGHRGIKKVKITYKGGGSGTTPTPPDPVTGSGYYALVTNASTLKAGDRILIAYIEGKTKLALSTTQNNNNRAATDDVTLNDDGTLKPGKAAQVITLEEDDGNYLFNVGDGYLYAASSDKNYLRTESKADDNAKAAISINSSNGNATITFQGDNERNTMRFNPNGGTPIFSCYSSATGSLPQIYRELPAQEVDKGNVNGDEGVDFKDVQMAISWLLGQNPKDFNKDAADMDGNGKVDIKDVTAIIEMVLTAK